MRQLLNTLYITTENAYLTLDGENAVVQADGTEIGRIPLHTIQSVITFSYAGASPSFMGYCAEHEINLSFCTPRGRFLARTIGHSHGNVLLRREQYRIADDEKRSLEISKNMIYGKLYNARWCLERTKRDHKMRVDVENLSHCIDILKSQTKDVFEVHDEDSLRGCEGVAAAAYFCGFDDMILSDKENFFFHGRNRRPPLDKVNALLSFAYSLLANDCASALESVGLDSYVGFMHTDRPGRKSLALDIMEELRACMADRFVITLINNRMISASDFVDSQSGAVTLTDDGRRTFLKEWQEKKKETITHPYLGEKMPWGLVPYVQSLLLSRYIRGDIDGYPPFLWK